MKKQKPLVLVILCMFLLLLLIVIPPVFRKYIPKEQTKSNKNSKSIEILTCNKTFSDNIHIGTSKSKYINNKLITNTIEFVVNSNNINNQIDSNNNGNNNQSYEQEYQGLVNMKNINVETNDNATKIVINEEIANDNLNEEGFNYYFQDLTNQKGFYEYMGYSCQITKG